MFSKINIIDIVLDHINTLRNSRTNKIYFPDLFLFFILPLFLSGVLIYKDLVVNTQLATALLAAFSVFAALLLNLLLLVFDIADKVNKKDEGHKIFYNILKEIYINISFCILLSVIIIVVLFSFFAGFKSVIYLRILSFITYSISINFILSLVMILKRIYRLLTKKMSVLTKEF